MRSFKSAGGLALAGLCLALAGCVNAPMTSYSKPRPQPKIGAAGHWDSVANDVVAKTLGNTAKDRHRAHHAGPRGLPAEPSQFDKGFRELIITKLVQSGVTVMQQPAQAQLQVSYGAQVVRHGKRLPNPETRADDDGGAQQPVPGAQDRRLLPRKERRRAVHGRGRAPRIPRQEPEGGGQ